VEARTTLKAHASCVVQILLYIITIILLTKSCIERELYKSFKKYWL